MDQYYIAVDSQDVIIAVSRKKTKEYLNVKFSLTYLNHIGMSIDESAISTRVYNPYILYKYNRANRSIEVTSNVSALKKGIIRNLKLICETGIKKGFSLELNGELRTYHCSITDQLAIGQAIAIAQANKECDIKCIINGVSDFIPHSLDECQQVMLALSEHILEMRRSYFQYQKEILETSDQDILNVEWSRPS